MKSAAVLIAAACLAGCASPGHRMAWDDPAPTPADWVDRELAPELARRLAEHPRFAGEVVAIGLPAGTRGSYSRLEQRLEGVLESRLSHSSGLRLQAPVPGRCGTSAPYAVGFAVRPVDAEARVELRVMDTRSGEWVSGLADSWQGRLSRRDAADQAAPAELPRRAGTRSRPFAPGEEEQAAEALAGELSCALVTHRLSLGAVQPGPDPLAGLTSGYLANLGHTRSDRDTWSLTVLREPADAATQRVVAVLASGAGRVTAQAWIGTTKARALTRARVEPPIGVPVASPPVLGQTDCGRGCLGVALEDSREAVVFAVIPGRGLSSTRGCPVRIDPHGRSVTTVPEAHAGWARFYAVRARGEAAARLERLSRRLPSACGAEILSAEADWLSELERLADDAGPAMAWTAATARRAPLEEVTR